MALIRVQNYITLLCILYKLIYYPRWDSSSPLLPNIGYGPANAFGRRVLLAQRKRSGPGFDSQFDQLIDRLEGRVTKGVVTSSASTKEPAGRCGAELGGDARFLHIQAA